MILALVGILAFLIVLVCTVAVYCVLGWAWDLRRFFVGEVRP